MKLFSFKKKKPETQTAKDTKGVLGVQEKPKEKVLPKEHKKVPTDTKMVDAALFSDATRVLKNPRITEKANDTATDHNTYVFDVAQDANKIQIKRAIKELYNVDAQTIRIVPVPKKMILTRKRRKAFKGGGKKAYVSLKKGDSIQVV